MRNEDTIDKVFHNKILNRYRDEVFHLTNMKTKYWNELWEVLQKNIDLKEEIRKLKNG